MKTLYGVLQITKDKNPVVSFLHHGLSSVKYQMITVTLWGKFHNFDDGEDIYSPVWVALLIRGLVLVNKTRSESW